MREGVQRPSPDRKVRTRSARRADVRERYPRKGYTMTRDDVIRMARTAGSSPYTNRHFPERPFHTFSPEALERFAALVAYYEREECAKVCEKYRDDWLRGRGRYEFMGEGADYCADAIRARGTHEA